MGKKIIRENLQRNEIIYGLWDKGCTIEEISSRTGVPRSSVGYYVRKFNKNARDGKSIVIQHMQEQTNEKGKACTAYIKYLVMTRIIDCFKKGESDEIMKFLKAYKFYRELSDELAVIEEEDKAFCKNIAHIVALLSLGKGMPG